MSRALGMERMETGMERRGTLAEGDLQCDFRLQFISRPRGGGRGAWL
jgi:hypothetical protein